MTITVLLQLFAPFSRDELYQRPQLADLRTAIAQTSPDPRVYEQIADQAFAELLLDVDEPRMQEYQRLVHILTVLLYEDGRTFTGCLRLAQYASDHPSFGIYGVNSLAALANYLRRGRPLPVSKSELKRAFTEFEANEDLQHNAGECLKMLRTAYPTGEQE
jgi:hypothetical protein